MPRRVGDFRGLTHISRLRLFDAVQREPGRKLQDLADATGLHINTARDHLRVLEGEGLIQSYSLTTGSRGRPPQVFHPVDDASTSPAAARRAEAARVRGEMLRRLEPDLDHTDELGTEAAHQIDSLYEHLDDSGLEPSSGENPLEMDLVPCHVDMIRKDQHLLCSVHERLIEQHLDQLPGPVELQELKPFAAKHRCSLTLVVREDGEDEDGQEAGGDGGDRRGDGVGSRDGVRARDSVGGRDGVGSRDGVRARDSVGGRDGVRGADDGERRTRRAS